MKIPGMKLMNFHKSGRDASFLMIKTPNPGEMTDR